MQADLLLINGTVRTLDPGHPEGEALAVGAGRILAIGDEAIRLRGSRTEVLDLRGGCALPAFTDSHCHLSAYGLAMEEVDCSPAAAPTLEALLVRIAAAARAAPPGQWVQARGYDDTVLRPARHPTRWELDAVAPATPVILRRRCGHVAVVNSLALRLAGITADGPVVAGGRIDRDAGGEPTGVLREGAQDLVRDLLPAPTVEQLKRAILRAAESYLAQGYAAVHDAGGRHVQEFVAYRELAAEGRLPLRVVLMVRDPWLEHCIEGGLATGFGDEWVRLGAVKLFADGGIGPRTAAVSRPYRGEPDNAGILRLAPDELRAAAGRAARSGFAVAIHAIGDTAIAAAVDALAHVTAASPPRYPHRIEHCVLPTAADMETMRRLGIAATVQPVFLHALGDSWLDNLSPELAGRCYPLRSLVAHGLLVTGGSDCPVAPANPLLGMQSAVLRRTAAGIPMVPAEAVDVETALRLYTDLPPRLMGEERSRGRLRPHLAADIVVLSADPLRVSPERLTDLTVRATVTGGVLRYQALASVAS